MSDRNPNHLVLVGPPGAEDYITPQGHDVRIIEEAEAYLSGFHGIDLPEAGGATDSRTGYHLALSLQKEDREAIYPGPEGRRQNVAEHSAKLAVTATWIAGHERPDLDLGKVTQMSLFHDLLEAYAGDTPVNDQQLLLTKFWREQAGMTLLRRDLEGNPLLDILEEYEEGESPEARFVRAMDKVEAYQFALNTRATLQRDRAEDYKEMVAKALPKAVIDPTAFELMQDVLIHLGRKWHVWECMPFEGEAEEIVRTLADQLMAEYTAVEEEDQAELAEVFAFPQVSSGPNGVGEQPVIDSIERAHQVGVTLMSAFRRSADNPPPQPPSPATAAISLG